MSQKQDQAASISPGRRYVYQPLNPATKEIRLLRLEPGSSDDSLRCTLSHVSLQQNPGPEYETISYVWGDARKVADITIDGAPHLVPEIAMRALRRVRHIAQFRVIWIDSVCIDQTSTLEKSQQAALMSEIYGNTRRNLIHLEQSSIDEEALIALAKVSSTYSIPDVPFSTFAAVNAYRRQPASLQRNSEPSATARTIARICQVEWFR